MLLAETINGETAISLQTLLTIFGLLGSSIVLSIVTIVTQGLALKQLRVELEAVKSWQLVATKQLSDYEKEEHAEKVAKEAVKEALRDTASRSGVRPTEYIHVPRGGHRG
jgi:uncharacterized membrane protein YjgN (DUF898 family)